MYYTYLHYNSNNKPIYVGKGKGKRAYQKRNYGEPYTVKIVHENISEAQALEFEEFLIEEIGIENLYNKRTKGNPSAVLLFIDYDNTKQELKRILSLSATEIRKYVNLVINDAATGNEKAIRFFMQRCPRDILFKIKELVKKNTDTN
jgi:predicted RNA-binding protein